MTDLKNSKVTKPMTLADIFYSIFFAVVFVGGIFLLLVI